MFFFFKQKTAYEMRISDWSSDVCSSDLPLSGPGGASRAGTLAVALHPAVGAARRGAGVAGRHLPADPRRADCGRGAAGAAVPGEYSAGGGDDVPVDRKSTRLNSSH